VLSPLKSSESRSCDNGGRKGLRKGRIERGIEREGLRKGLRKGRIERGIEREGLRKGLRGLNGEMTSEALLQYTIPYLVHCF
jgi:hypothetical protein